MALRNTLSLAPSTQHLAPSTQHLAPSTQHPAPSTQHLAPSTQHLAPSTQHLAPMTPLLQQLDIHSDHEAAELERDLGVRFDHFTTDDCETWIRQTVYLEQFSRTRVVSLAADDAGVSIRTARHWQADNTLGFNQRLEISVLRYTDVLEVMLLQRAQVPDSPPSLLMMLVRGQMPEKYGSARRGGPPRDNAGCDHHCGHDSQPTATSQYDKDFLKDIRRDLQNLKQFAGLSEPDLTPVQPSPNPSLGEHETPTHPDLSPADPPSTGAGFTPAHDPPAHSAASPPTPSPVVGESLPRTRYGGWGEGPAPSIQNLDPDRSSTVQTSVGAGIKPAHDPSAGDEDSDLTPTGGEIQRGGSSPTPRSPEPTARNLTRSQRRQLQRKQRKQRKHQNSRRARAPT